MIGRRPATLLALSLLAPLPAAASLPSSPALSPGAGITPGGLLWRVDPVASTLTLSGPAVGHVATHPLRPDERVVLGVEDDGSRVTASVAVHRWSRSFDGAPETRTRFVFRDPAGVEVARREVISWSDAPPAASGARVFAVRREKGRLRVTRTTLSEDAAPAGDIALDAIRRESGRLGSVTLHASPAGLVVELAGAYRSIYVVAGQRPVEIRPAAPSECDHAEVRVALPRGGGLARVLARGREVGGGEKDSEAEPDGPNGSLIVETLDRDGKRLRETPLRGASDVLALPGGGLVFRQGEETVTWDATDTETARAKAPDGETGDRDPAAPAAGRRLRSLGERATGADWAEYALLRGSEPYAFEGPPRRDPQGALRRLARVADADAERPQAEAAFHVLSAILGETWQGHRRPGPPAPKPASTLAGAAEAVLDETSPAWIRTVASLVLLSDPKSTSPAWALRALDAAIAADSVPDLATLPASVLTAERAEAVLAFDRSRLDAAVATALSSPYESNLSAFDGSLGGFRVPASRFASEILACASGAKPARRVAVANALVTPALRSSGWAPWSETPDYDEAASAAAEMGPAGAALLAGLGSDDADVRAVSLSVAPAYRLPFDAASFRRDVLSRDELLPIALTCLSSDRLLSSDAWSRLFADGVAALRRKSADPGACLRPLFARPGEEEGGDEEKAPDPYCNLIGPLVWGAAVGLTGATPPRAAEIAAFTRGASAPAELRFAGKLARSAAGAATAEEMLEILRSRDLPPALRTSVLWSASQVGVPEGVRAALPALLDEGGAPAAETAALLSALRTVDPLAARAAAAERWRKGGVPEDASALAWVEALEPSQVSGDDRLRESLRARLDDEHVGPEVSALLAKTGDADALPRVVAAIRTGCLKCLGKQEVLAIFGPLGAPAEAALEELCRAVPDSDVAATGLDALWDLAPARAAAIADERLSRSLDGGCVPTAVVRLLLRRGGDPFRAVVSRLEAGACRASALRASGPLGTDAADVKRAEAASSTITRPECRTAFRTLLSLETPAGAGAAGAKEE